MTTCLISGVTSGVGYSLGVSLMEDGHQVIGIGRNLTKLNEIKEKYQDLFIPINLDLGQVDEIKKVLKPYLKVIDSFVSCAGISWAANLRRMTYERFQQVMNINFFSFAEIVRLVVTYKDPLRPFRIIGMSSSASKDAGFNNTMYNASKAAMDGFVRGICKELLEKNTEINTLQPVFIDTPMLDSLKDYYGDSFESYINNFQPLGLIPVDDIVEEIRFLLFKQGRKVSGTARFINAGKI